MDDSHNSPIFPLPNIFAIRYDTTLLCKVARNTKYSVQLVLQIC